MHVFQSYCVTLSKGWHITWQRGGGRLTGWGVTELLSGCFDGIFIYSITLFSSTTTAAASWLIAPAAVILVRDWGIFRYCAESAASSSSGRLQQQKSGECFLNFIAGGSWKTIQHASQHSNTCLNEMLGLLSGENYDRPLLISTANYS